jgi:bifunctional non-homologous end joining protein LigD
LVTRTQSALTEFLPDMGELPRVFETPIGSLAKPRGARAHEPLGFGVRRQHRGSRRWPPRVPWGRNRRWNNRVFGCMSTKSPTRDTSISTYRAKRNFAVTAEPAPGPARQMSAPMFVVQKHHAHRAGLHWDFRLEHGGVLWSWAVRQGPSLDPADRRMAVHVEDHPIAYAEFQGTIADGEYGAGQVETWDRGTWEALEDPEKGMRKGSLRFVLSGQRLHGRFTLARLSQRDRKKPEGWFLIKGHDEFARAGVDAVDLEKETPLSQTTTSKSRGRSNAEGATAARETGPKRPPAKGTVRAPMPSTQEPQLCATAEEPPDSDDWITEIKFDGYRLIADVSDGTVRLLTCNGLDWTSRLPSLAREIARLPMTSAMLDGELVSLRPDGVSSFPGLQAALKAGRDDKLIFYAFDLLHLDGWDLRRCGQLDRKRLLNGLTQWTGMLRFSDHTVGQAPVLLRNACRMHLEGIVCKRADAPYRSGRGRSWVKVKCNGQEELIVLGWTPPGGSRIGIGALHLGYYDPEGKLHYAGAFGSGFDEQELQALRQRLDALAAPPPEGMLVSGDPIDRSINWVRPELVTEVRFTDWSGSGRVRHAVYLGLREDKAASDVVREIADPGAARVEFKRPRVNTRVVGGPKRSPAAVPPLRAGSELPPPGPSSQLSNVVVARPPRKASVAVGGVELSHPDRQLWPGITKQAPA